MSDAEAAERQLRVIRSLMERATIYRSLSAPTALVGGLLSLGGLGVTYLVESFTHREIEWEGFLGVWLTILVLTVLTNAFFLAREAKKRGTPLFSAGMKCAMSSMAPPFFLAGFLTIFSAGFPILCTLEWIGFYGLALLATQNFAPRSIVVLGWVFLVGGIVLPVLLVCIFKPEFSDASLVPSALMAATFGGFHIVYAIAVWVSGEERADASSGAGNV